MNIKDRANKLKTDIPALFLALKSRKTPWYAKVFAALTVAYALSPIDLIPDFIPFLGYLDDIIILPLLAALTIALIPKVVFAEFRHRVYETQQLEMRKKWYYSIPIVAVWILVIFLIIKAI